jgi:biotin carboxylase
VKTALLLGLNPVVLDAVRFLKQGGWRVLACGNRPAASGLPYVDRFEMIDYKDVDALERLARGEHVNLVYSLGSDLAMLSTAVVAERLQLPHFVSSVTAQMLQDKTSLRAYLNERGISPVQYRKVESEDDLAGWAAFPAMMKPAASQGQRGISRVDSMPEARTALAEAQKYSPSGTALIEEFLDGAEVSANLFLADGDMAHCFISDRIVACGFDCGVPAKHIYPSECCRGSELRETEALARRCYEAFGISNGPIYLQIKLTPLGPRILEITPRLDGCHLWRLIRAATGVDLLACSLDRLSGVPHLPQTKSIDSNSELVFFLSPPGTVFRKGEYILPPDAAYAEYYLQEGEVVPPANGRLEKVGYYISSNAS